MKVITEQTRHFVLENGDEKISLTYRDGDKWSSFSFDTGDGAGSVALPVAQLSWIAELLSAVAEEIASGVKS